MISKPDLFAHMQLGYRVITPNNRLSAALLQEFAEIQNKAIQDKPVCLPYSAFLSLQWKEMCHENHQIVHPIVLNDLQLRSLWKDVLPFSSNEGLLDALIDAWSRCYNWRLDFSHQAFSSNPQTWQFKQWAETLLHKMEKLGAISAAQVPQYLLQHHKASQSPIIWVCFDDYTPEQLALQNHYESLGASTLHFDIENHDCDTYLYAAPEDYQEQEQLIVWLQKNLLRQNQKVAVVVPDLNAKLHSLTRLLSKHFSKEQFNISFGEPLAEYALVAHALCFLQLDGLEITHTEAQLILHSPYLALSQNEMLSRAQFLEDTNLFNEPTVSQTAFISELKKYGLKLADYLASLKPYPKQATIGEWVSCFKDRLIQLHFPGEYPLNSQNYQCYHRLITLLDEFRQLALIHDYLDQAEALETLFFLAKTTLFQAKKSPANIQVLGLLEAGGCTFDALWIMGVDDQCLPKSTKLSPFIPFSVQKELAMPYASSEREWNLAKKIIQRFAMSSREVVFSYSRFSEDKPNRPSPLISHFAPYSSINTPFEPNIPSLVSYQETYCIPLKSTEQAKGGTALLANQAKCPFRSFAAHRLHAKASETTSIGPDAKERGQILHKIMELLWRNLQGKKQLLALSEQELDEKMNAAIREALNPFIEKRPYSFSSLVQEMEWKRLKRLLAIYLDWERNRPDFNVVALEEMYTIALNNMELKVRVDRLDLLEDGQTWVIDYKSSLPQNLPWNQDRPQEPQLLLYALLDESIKGLLFFQLKTGQLKCQGLSEENSSVPGVSYLKNDISWDSQRLKWKSQLEELANEFVTGICEPDPVTAGLCQLCDFQNLCRFNKEAI